MTQPPTAEETKSKDAMLAVLNYGDAVSRTDMIAGIAQQYLEGVAIGAIIWNNAVDAKRRELEAVSLARAVRNSTEVRPLNAVPPAPVPVTVSFLSETPLEVLPRERFLSFYGQAISTLLAFPPQPGPGGSLLCQVLPESLQKFYGIVMDASLDPKVGAELAVRPEVRRTSPVTIRRRVIPVPG